MEKLALDYVNEPNSIHFQNVNNEVTLKKTSKWYYQIQGQLGIYKKKMV